MKVDHSVKSVLGGAIQDDKSRPLKQPAADSGAAPASTSVQLSPLSARLQTIESGLGDGQVVDAARVAEIKQAITEGRFKINAEVIADRLLETVRELIRSHKG